MAPDINDEVDEHGTPYNDAWKSTSFSTQRTYKQTVMVSSIACICLIAVIGVSFSPHFAEDCGYGYYQEAEPKAMVVEAPPQRPKITKKTKSDGTGDRMLATESSLPTSNLSVVSNLAKDSAKDKPMFDNFFNFINQNVCGKCQIDNCGSCQEAQGKHCDSCFKGYFMHEKACLECEFENNSCEECRNNDVCLKCASGYTLREFTNEDDELKKACLACPTEDGCDTCYDNKC